MGINPLFILAFSERFELSYANLGNLSTSFIPREQKMAGVTGFEPVIYARSTIWCHEPLGYTPLKIGNRSDS